MASGRAEILRSRQLLRDGNAIRGTRPICPSRAALVRLSPINSSEFPHDDKLILMRARLAFQSRFRRRSHGTDPVKRVASALLELSSKAGLASAREKRIGELLHRVEAVAVSGISLSIHASEVPEPCMAPARERESLQAMAELKPEERSLTNIDRKTGYRKTTVAGFMLVSFDF